MTDVTTELLPAIQSEFQRLCNHDAQLRVLAAKIRNGSTSYADAYAYARRLSANCSKAMLKHFTADKLPNGKLYENIARKIMNPMLSSTHNYITEATAEIQRAINNEIGIEFEPQMPEFNEDRIDGIAKQLGGFDDLEMARRAIDDDVENFNSNVVDESVEANASAQHRAGVHVTVHRTCAGNACDWCSSLAGTYEYEAIKGGSDVWRRHRGCTCVLTFNSDKSKVVWGNGDRFKWRSSNRNTQYEIDQGIRNANGRMRTAEAAARAVASIPRPYSKRK